MVPDFKVIDIPDAEWLTRLRRGHYVFAPKENLIMCIEWAWEPPEPSFFYGSVGVEKMWIYGDQWGRYEEGAYRWYVSPDGKGMDGTQILLPLEGNCPDELTPISDVWQRHVEHRLALLTHYVDQIVSRISLANGFE
jgi:hypothetical protein